MNINQFLDGLIQFLVTSNVGIPLIFGIAASVTAAVKSVGHAGPSLSEIADKIAIQCDKNKNYGEVEIGRLRTITQ